MPSTEVDAWLAAKAEAGLSWATRMDLRNIMCGIFTKADDWHYFEDRNPAERATVGRKRAAREKRKLTDEQARRLFAVLPEDVRDIIGMSLFLTLRISEVFGLQEKHLDFEAEQIHVGQRFYRGDLDEVKSSSSRRDRPMGYYVDMIRQRCTGDPENFVFKVKTRFGYCRDDRDINQHFLRPAAKELGIYYKGFGFHAFRRESITAQSQETDAFQVMRGAGHSKADMTLLYTLEDRKRQEVAVRRHQERILGSSTEGSVQ